MTKIDWTIKVKEHLEKKGPCYVSDLIKKLKVPDKEKRTFYRAIQYLKRLSFVKGEKLSLLRY